MTLFEIYLRRGVEHAIGEMEAKLRTLTREARDRLSDEVRAYFEGQDREIVAAIGELRRHLADTLRSRSEVAR